MAAVSSADPELVGSPRHARGGIAQLQTFGGFFGIETMFESVFTIAEYTERAPFATGAGLEVTAFRVPHYTVESYGFRITDGQTTLAYSADSAPSEQLVEMARDADLFLCEATLIDSDADSLPRGHLSADEAVAAFERSGAKRLLLTHRPEELPLDDSLEQAAPGLKIEI